ncbi:MAG: ornithine carbamoyltransferase, partial [Clostridium sp.]|nr:ornithine carbamoyltransferase [Clostridium sp.]
RVTYLDPGRSQMGQKESIADTARVLGRMYDGIEYRGFDQKIVDELAEYAGVPVWNGLTDQFHPTQMLADLLTLEEKFGRLKGLNFTYMGDARNNMGNSLMVACAKMGINFTACAPKELFPAEDLVSRAREIAGKNGCTVRLTEDIDQGAKDADAVYTDIWVSMGEPDEVWGTRIKLLRGYQVNAEVMKKAKPSAIFMHCLPSFHDTNTTIGAEIAKKFGINEMEVTNEVFESRQSVVFDEAENRMHTIKAVIYATLC